MMKITLSLNEHELMWLKDGIEAEVSYANDVIDKSKSDPMFYAADKFKLAGLRVLQNKLEATIIAAADKVIVADTLH